MPEIHEIKASRATWAKVAETCVRPPGRGVAYGFQAKENGSRAPEIRVGARCRGGAMLKWTAERAWIGSRLTANGKYRSLDPRKQNPFTDQQLACSTMLTAYGSEQEARKAGETKPVFIEKYNVYWSEDDL